MEKIVKKSNALKKSGIKVENIKPDIRRWLAEELMNGFGSTSEFIVAGACYDAAAYVLHLLHPDLITLSHLENISGQHWPDFFDQNFEYKRLWKGTIIEKGNMVIFHRDGKPFHGAIAVGGTCIRAVNGGRLGAGWDLVDLKTVLKERLSSGAYKYEKEKVKVWIYSRSVI